MGRQWKSKVIRTLFIYAKHMKYNKLLRIEARVERVEK